MGGLRLVARDEALQCGEWRRRGSVALEEHAIDGQPLAFHVAFPLGGHGQGVGGAPGPEVGGGALEAAAGFHQGHHRLHQGQHITLQKQLTPGSQGHRQSPQQGRLQHPALVVARFEPGIGELEGHQRQEPGGKAGQPVGQADAGIGEEKAQVGQSRLLSIRLRGLRQRAADLQAEMVALRLEGGQGEQKAAASAADVEVEGQGGIGEELLKGGQGPRQLMKAAERIDVLTHHQPLGIKKAQQAV
jgi:hypothetical protein